MMQAYEAERNELVSESTLHRALISKLGACLVLHHNDKGIIIPCEDVDRIVRTWKESVERQACRLVRAAASMLANLPTGCLYQRLEDPVWRAAAHISEVFRRPEITKNAGRLDTLALQRRLQAILADGAALTFTIAWGQPKRTAGGLKAAGPHPDLAEMYSIARLSMLVQAISQISRTDVELTVLSGAGRFIEALFMRSAVAEAYDKARQRIAEAFTSPCRIRFTPYHELQKTNSGNTAHLAQVWADRFAPQMAKLSDEEVSAKFGTILLNIDWEHVFAPDPSQRMHRPHGIQLPENVERWISAHDSAECARLVRATIVGLTSPKYQAEWLRTFDNDEVLESALAFVQAVTWESTRKYLAIQYLAADDANRRQSESDPEGVRLTVHEKRNRHDIPAVFMLSPSSGNLLPQHVLAGFFASGDLIFESHAELTFRQFRPVHLSTGALEDGLFSWLAAARQPLCFVEKGNDNVIDLICLHGRSF